MHRSLRLVAAATLVAACSNAGADRVLAITGAGQVSGQVFFDADGNGLFAPPDSGFHGVSLALVAAGTVDTVARTVSALNGTFTFGAVTVGSYTLVVDTTTIVGVGLHLTRVDTSAVVVGPSSTTSVTVAVSYLQVSLNQVRTLPHGTKVFVVGLTLDSSGIFGDSILNVADASGALRIVSMRGSPVPGAGDSIRVLGTQDTLNLQPALRFSSYFLLGNTSVPPVQVLTVANAVTANGGSADAALVTLQDTVKVLDTATFSGYRRLHVTDPSAGVLEVRLDSLVGFFGLALARDTVGAQFKLSGLLFPTPVAGVWILKPRSTTDQR